MVLIFKEDRRMSSARPKGMREGEQYVENAAKNGAITRPQAEVLRRHARHHSRTHMFVMLRLIINDRKPIPVAHREAVRLVGKREHQAAAFGAAFAAGRNISATYRSTERASLFL